MLEKAIAEAPRIPRIPRKGNFSPATWKGRDEMALHVFLAAYTRYPICLSASLCEVLAEARGEKL